MLAWKWLNANATVAYRLPKMWFYLEMCPSRFSLSLISSAADQSWSGEVIICHFTLDGKKKSPYYPSIQAPLPELDIREKWPPCEHGQLLHGSTSTTMMAAWLRAMMLQLWHHNLADALTTLSEYVRCAFLYEVFWYFHGIYIAARPA